ncbi:MAG TPA: hypothetical protein VE955_10910, partial [Candidatus Dormibacteraeota bacterium]|nr:hypothetical protein [Candidatus Dormibacteraeota bacterium]
MNEISDQTVSEIKLLSHIAKANRTVLSIADVVALTSTTLTENALIEAWNLNRDLSDAYVLRHDLVVEKWTPLLESSPNNLTHETQKKKRSEEYIRYANQFLNWCQGRHARLLSVSGSTSYNSAMPGDDLDFFVVSPQNHLWIFLVKSLLLARIYRMVHRKCPRICLSYVIDDSFASKAFGAQDPLLARDTLNVVVLYGNAAYASLLRRNNWMANYFPKLYRRRSGEAGPDLSVSQPQGITAFTRC